MNPFLIDLCQCSNTYKEVSSQMRSPNFPLETESLYALEKLIQWILLPLHREFGYSNIKLSYGFCGAELKSHLIKRKALICPKVDQHMSHELNSKGKRFCKHDGAACDLQIIGITSKKLVKCLSSLHFDSIYYYGENRSVHVSYQPLHTRQAVWDMTTGVPQKYKF
jgi:hypothetical protein